MVLLKYADFIKKLLADFHIAVIGCGNVGTEVARTILGFGGTVSIFDPFLTNAEIYHKVSELKTNPTGTIKICNTFSQLIKSKNLTALTLHVPLTRRAKNLKHPTYHLMNHKIFEQLTQTSLRSNSPLLLINSARGGVVAEHDLLPFLADLPNQAKPFTHNGITTNPSQGKRAWFYAADVWEYEPKLNPHLVSKCFFATPHIGGYSDAAKRQAARQLVGKIISQLMPQHSNKLLILKKPKKLQGKG